MNEAKFLKLISGTRRGTWADLQRAALRVLACGYALGTATRNRLFDFGIRRTHRVSAPVISIGNITAGGTGKTPFVAYVVDWLIRRGIRPGIVSRGYRSLRTEDGTETGNDEKLVLDRLCPGIPHVQNRNRIVAAQRAISHHNCQVIVLDDGFQHRRIARDLDVVLIDATNPFGHGHILPRGLLRESREGLSRADVVALTRCEQVVESEIQSISGEIQRYSSAPVIRTSFVPTELRSADGNVVPMSDWNKKPAAAFCGIGNPTGFWKTLDQAGVKSICQKAFADHHEYTQSEVERLVLKCKSAGGEWLATTAKDLVKIRKDWCQGLPIFAVDIELQVCEAHVDRLFEVLANSVTPT